MKRVGKLYETLISKENLIKAIEEVNRTHHWKGNHKPNRTTAWVEETKEERVKVLREIIEKGYTQKPPRILQRYDVSAGKWRQISEPVQWPDQYIHHALIQTIQPVMMRGMDRYCCGSIGGRGIHYAKRDIERWMNKDERGTRYTLVGDIRHFYESLRPEAVMDRMRRLIKDGKVLDLIERITADGIKIGAYPSQWFANTVLQPMDVMIRQSGLCSHYVRYMDNLTIFGANKRKLGRLRNMIRVWLEDRGLKLKHDWQIFPTVSAKFHKGRMPDAVGYRYGRGYTLPRKKNLLRMKRALAKYRKRKEKHMHIPASMAESILSRMGQLKHCSNVNLYGKLFRGEKILREMKKIAKSRESPRLTWEEYMKRRKEQRINTEGR